MTRAPAPQPSRRREPRSTPFLQSDDLHNLRQRLGSVMMLHDRGELRTDFPPLRLTVAYSAPRQQQGYGMSKRLIAGPANGHPAGPIDDLATRLR